MTNRNKTLKRIIRSVLLGIIIGGILCLPGTLTYAHARTSSPNVQITIDRRGTIRSVGNMFDNRLWYPGKKENGTIRISNDFKRIKITGMDVQMQLLKWKPEYDKSVVESSLLRNMELTVNKKNNLFQSQMIISHQRLFKLVRLFRGALRREKGYHLNAQNQFYLDKGDFTDLDYSLVMDLESGNELQDISANVGINVSLEER